MIFYVEFLTPYLEKIDLSFDYQLEGITLLKLIFLLGMVFIIIYFFKVLKILLRARKNLQDININIKKKAQKQNNQGKNGQKTYTLSSDDYKVEK